MNAYEAALKMSSISNKITALTDVNEKCKNPSVVESNKKVIDGLYTEFLDLKHKLEKINLI